MTTQPEPRSVTEARDDEPETWRGEGIIEAIKDGRPLGSFARARLLELLAATPATARAVVPDTGYVPGMAYGTGGNRLAPAVVPAVEWHALALDIATAILADQPNNAAIDVADGVVAEHRPLIEAAIRAEYRDWMPEDDCVDPPVRAEGRGALDVALDAELTEAQEWCRQRSYDVPLFALAHARAALAQREPAESQGPDGGAR